MNEKRKEYGIMKKENLFIDTENNKSSSDIWSLPSARMSNFNYHALEEMLLYRYHITGSTLFKNIIQRPMYEQHDLDLINFAASTTGIMSGDKAAVMVDSRVEELLHRFRKKKVVLGLSGGADSTFLLCKLAELGIDVVCVNVSYCNYNENEEAKKLAHHFGYDYYHLDITPQQIIKDIPKIIKKLGTCYERGSSILTYYIFEFAHNKLKRNTFVFGDSADNIFSPSMSYALKFSRQINKTPVDERNLKIQELYWKLSGLDFKGLFPNSSRIKFQLPILNTASEPLTALQLIDFLHESPYFHRTRYNQYMNEKDTTILPFESLPLTILSLSQRLLHEFPQKFYLTRLLKKYLPIDMCERQKIPYKVEPWDYNNIIKSQFDEELLKGFVNTDYLLHGNWSRTKNKVWSTLELSLLCTWLKESRYH